ncbi:MAG: hypothetical protein IPN76_08410 [Saprospiraceae bacterium]|nr:hypothetical protein [Saprospiraceae bacterium]
MVRIDKTGVTIPAILDNSGQGDLLTRQMMVDYDNGIREFKISSKIYGHKTVKEALKILQHGKCCFCEARVSHISHGDVEHFRPKAGFNSKPRTKLIKPGYFWLAYNYLNLFFSCQICNQSYKKNYFPLVDETKRVRSHNGKLSQEESLILHPENDYPEIHLTFNKEVILPKSGSQKGAETIKRTGLDRKKLDDNRLEYYLTMEILARVARDSSNPESTAAKAHFKTLGLSSSPYSLMIRCNFLT